MGKTMTTTRRRRLYRVRNAARRLRQAVDALSPGDLDGVAIAIRSFLSVAAGVAGKMDERLSRILDDDFTEGGS